MKIFIATKKNIDSLMGEINKVLMKNQFWGHHYLCGTYSRKNNRRPKRINVNERTEQYFGFLAEKTDIHSLCDLNYDGYSSPEYLTSIFEGDKVLIDGKKIHIISNDKRVKFINKKEIVTRILRKFYSIIPATESTSQDLHEYFEELNFELQMKSA